MFLHFYNDSYQICGFFRPEIRIYRGPNIAESFSQIFFGDICKFGDIGTFSDIGTEIKNKISENEKSCKHSK